MKKSKLYIHKILYVLLVLSMVLNLSSISAVAAPSSRDRCSYWDDDPISRDCRYNRPYSQNAKECSWPCAMHGGIRWIYHNGKECSHCGWKAHAHTWNYVAGSTDLIAESTCHEDSECAFHTDNGKTLTLTLTASSPSYSDSAATITVGTEAERTAWIGAIGESTIPEVYYVGRDGTTLSATTTAPTTAGKYTAYISPKDVEKTESNTAKVDFEIKKNNPTLTGSVLSGGSLWIIIGAALAAVIALVLAKKKQGK